MRIEQVTVPLIRAVVQRPRLAQALLGRDRWGNPFSDEVFRNPEAASHLLLADGPVAYRRLYQQWFVTGFDEARQVLASSSMVVAPQFDTMLSVRPYSQLTPSSQTFFRTWLIAVDPPNHSRLRRLVSKAFTPRRIRDLEPRIAEIADEGIASMRGIDTPDVADHLTIPLPVNVISELMGFPPERRVWARAAATEVTKLLDPFQAFDPDVMNATIDELAVNVRELAAERIETPADDLITALAQAEDEGDRLSTDELVAMVGFLLFAGHETTAGLLGNSIVALAANPDQRALLRDNADLWPNAIEELIRYDTAVRADPRSTTEPVEIAGHTIPAGANVLVMVWIANRDPRHFDRPDDLWLDRPDPNSISFGHGIHHCLGASLARAELRIGLQAFLDDFGDYTIDEGATEWKASATLRGPVKLPVRRG